MKKLVDGIAMEHKVQFKKIKVVIRIKLTKLVRFVMKSQI